LPSQSVICRLAPENGTRHVPAKAGIEHRLFSFITQNWRGKPLVSYQTIVQLIAATTTRTGLNVKCEIDFATYPAGVKVSDRDMAAINITPHAFHGEWNYTIKPDPE
jgi:Rhodopirellula transposase DDE domain